MDSSMLYAPLVGRILLGGYFVWSGIQKILNFSAYVEYFNHTGLPYSLWLALAVVSIETLAGILLVVDFQSRLVSLWLAAYLLVSSIVFFKVSAVVDTQIFLSNLAIIGGLLVMSAVEPIGSKRRR
jgi:putative oxidoreductase